VTHVPRRRALAERSTAQERRTVETPLVRHVIDQQDAHSTSVVCGGDGAEALLAGRVPYLQLHALAVELDGPDLEVDSDSRDEGRRERVFAEAQQAAGLADARVADQEQFDLCGPTVSMAEQRKEGRTVGRAGLLLRPEASPAEALTRKS
jgi:hypothetical protein